MSCRHDLALTTCTVCYPDTGTIQPTKFGPNLEGPGAVPDPEVHREEMARMGAGLTVPAGAPAPMTPAELAARILALACTARGDRELRVADLEEMAADLARQASEATVCSYCGHRGDRDPERQLRHIVECPKRPEGRLLTIIERLELLKRETLRRLEIAGALGHGVKREVREIAKMLEAEDPYAGPPFGEQHALLSADLRIALRGGWLANTCESCCPCCSYCGEPVAAGETCDHAAACLMVKHADLVGDVNNGED